MPISNPQFLCLSIPVCPGGFPRPRLGDEARPPSPLRKELWMCGITRFASVSSEDVAWLGCGNSGEDGTIYL
ncbi:hypothetical protein H6F88_15620 [Oculatella sp. FACHB-28]|nr:hypothetical protein [Oculatella sp. FACHB-28]